MKSDLNSVEFAIIENALGLSRGSFIYRNQYFVRSGSPQERVVRALESRGHMKFVMAVEDSNLRVYEVTPSTIALMTEELHG